MTKKAAPPDRIRGFTSLSDHEAGTAEGKIAVTELEGYSLRRIWHNGEWWHSVVDVVGALSESSDGRNYWKVLKKRLKEEGSDQSVTNCNQLKLPAADGKNYKTDCATTNTLFRIVQSVPSRRAEPIKQFLATVGAERLEEIAQPSRIVDRAIQTYRDKGRDDEWIDGRLQNISSRNELTDEWKHRGAEGVKAAPITAAMSKEMLGVTPKEHKDMKGIDDSIELRDQFDNLELAVTTLGERAAKEIIKARNTKTFDETKKASLAGAKVAGDAARKIEEEIGHSIANASNFLTAEEKAKIQARAAEKAAIPKPEKKTSSKTKKQAG